jgi:hypothetical protein
MLMSLEEFFELFTIEELYNMFISIKDINSEGYKLMKNELKKKLGIEREIDFQLWLKLY